jgi:hypothetical protein
MAAGQYPTGATISAILDCKRAIGVALVEKLSRLDDGL